MPKIGSKTFFTAIFVLIFQSAFSQKTSGKVAPVSANPVYEKHLSASKKVGTKMLETSKQLNSAKKKGKLLTIKSRGKGYKIMQLDYSHPVLISKAKEILREISAEFYKKSKGNSFTISSLTRTSEEQKKLRNVNSNAATGESTHNFGNAFDVSYVRFDNRLENNLRLEKLLEKVLIEFESTGKIYYIKEKKQRCFHVTVR